jgi:tetratricopeptide (TPR) repeat protein
MRGDLDKAEEMNKKSLIIEEKLGNQEGMASDYNNLATIYYSRDNLDEAEEMFKKSLAINEKLGWQVGIAIQYGNLGLIARKRGDLDHARKLWTTARALFAKIGMPHMVEKHQGFLDALPPTKTTKKADKSKKKKN